MTFETPHGEELIGAKLKRKEKTLLAQFDDLNDEQVVFLAKSFGYNVNRTNMTQKHIK